MKRLFLATRRLRACGPAAVFAAFGVLAAMPALAHHSYAMFDRTRMRTVTGTVAKFEWTNPHVFVWCYVVNAKGDGYDLYAFATGSITSLVRRGWSKTAMKPGEKLTVDYAPLRDGRPGGELIRAAHADGTVSSGDSEFIKQDAVPPPEAKP